MPKFTYDAINETGNTISDRLDADSLENANSILASRGLIPTRINEERAGLGKVEFAGIMESFTSIKAAELILFTKQFNTMIRAGVSMMRLFEVLVDQTENTKLKRVLSSMHQDIKEGASLHEAFSKYPRVFSSLYCSMIRAGETSGALPEVLERLTYIIEHENKVKSDIKSALMYPIIVISFLFVAFIILLTGVIPKFVNIFNNAGLKLPLPTQICMLMYNFLINYWYLVIAGVVGGIAALLYYVRTDQGKLVRDTFMMKLPILGPVFIKSAISRFASIFAILQASGVDVLESMDILVGTIGNAGISKELIGIKDRLAEGHGISGPLSQAKYFTPMLINMVAVGEESGNLEDMLNDVAEHYDTEVEYSTRKLSQAIAPILTIGLAAVVGFFALAIFLPMWDLTLMTK